MRRGQGLLLGLMAGMLLGCVSGEPVRSVSWLDRLRASRGPLAQDVVQMDVALIERPIGDPYLDRDLWTFADEQAIGLEHKALLEDNGFRIAQVGGIPPTGFQDLLTSERSCINPMRFQLHAGGSKPVSLGPPLPTCRFELRQDGRKTPTVLDRAECLLVVAPTLTSDGRTRLHFTPTIRHGENLLIPRPAADHSGWDRQRPTEEYPGLSWDVSLAPNEYVIVGTRYDRPGTLGHEFFLRANDPRPVQRLLVIRTGRAAADLDPVEGDESAGRRSPPLALQASWTSARGRMP